MGISGLPTPIPIKITVGVAWSCIHAWLMWWVAIYWSRLPHHRRVTESSAWTCGPHELTSGLSSLGLTCACLPTMEFWVRISSASAILYHRSRPHTLIILQFRTYKKASRRARVHLSWLHQYWLSLSEVARCDSVQGFKFYGCLWGRKIADKRYDRPAARLVCENQWSTAGPSCSLQPVSLK